jgi:hypothetical protein
MSKRAILQITPAKKADGSDYNLFLTLDEFRTTDGQQWTWFFPQHFGWGPNDAGIFTKNMTDTTILFCLQNDGSTEVMQIQGIVSRTLGDFPFTPDDQANNLSGNLNLEVDNYYLTAGNYTWTVWQVIV